MISTGKPVIVSATTVRKEIWTLFIMVEDMSEEKREYVIGKLEKYAGIIEGISTAAQSFMPQELKSKLFELHGLNSELLERVRNNSFEIAIVGLEKAGKSTFANALIGLDILPAKEERCTYTSSCVKYADQTYAEVEYYTSGEFNERFESNLRALGADFDSYEYGRVTLAELEAKINENDLDANRRNILEDVSDMIRSEFAIMPLLGKSDQHFNEASMKDAEFRNLIQNPDRTDGEYVPKPSFAVKKITVYSDKLEDMRNCIIYDVPGFDSPTAIHMEQTKERMDKADAIILIANASKPSLTGPQLTIFSSAVDSDNIPFNEKVFVFANRADESKDLEYNMGTLKNDLDKYHILRKNDSNRLIPGSAYAALCIAGGREDDQAVANLKANGISDGIEEIKKKLKEYNDVVRIHVIEKRVENLEKMILETADAIKLSCSAVSSGDGSNADMINAFVDVQNKIKEKLVFFESEIRKILDEKPLTSGLLAALKGKLNTGELLPDEDEISYIKERCTQSTAQFEASLRDFKRAEVREIFSEVTQCVTEDLKRETADELTGILLECFNVTPDHLYFEEIKTMTREYVDGYYRDFNLKTIQKTLTLRFCDEVFELLINKPFLMPDRLDFFLKNIDNIAALAVYDHSEEESRISNSKMDIADMPLVRSILFHEGTDGANSFSTVSPESRQKYIADLKKNIVLKLHNNLSELDSLAEQTVDWCCESGLSVYSFIQSLNRILPDLRFKRYSNEKECDELMYYLSLTSEHLEFQMTGESSKMNLLISRYNEACKSRENTHEWVIERFKEDISILVNIISGPVVSALGLEIPFAANVSEITDKIKQHVQDKDTLFVDFYGKVYPKSEYQKIEENESVQKINAEKKAVLENIDVLLEELGKR